MGRLLEYFLNKYPYTDFHQLNADWLISVWKELLEEVNSLDSWKVTHEAEYDELKQLYDDMLAGNYPDTFIDSLRSWISANINDIVATYLNFIVIGLTDDGYMFISYPSSWSEVKFNTTGLDINVPVQPEYGHLVISY